MTRRLVSFSERHRVSMTVTTVVSLVAMGTGIGAGFGYVLETGFDHSILSHLGKGGSGTTGPTDVSGPAAPAAQR